MILSNASLPVIGLTWAAVAAYLVPAWAGQRTSATVVRWTLAAAWLLHALALAMGLLGESGPRFGFAPALSMTAWLVLTVYAVESRMYPEMKSRLTLCVLGAVTMLLALVFPGSALHPDTSPWLPLHWLLGIASYAMFAIAVVHAWLLMRSEAQFRRAAESFTGIPLLTLERLIFHFVWTGFILLTATLVAGWFFGSHLQTTAAGAERVMRWDHKTLFSVLSWLAFALLLAGRWRFGWRGRNAVRMLYLGSGLLLLAYVGSRFVLEVILGRAL